MADTKRTTDKLNLAYINSLPQPLFIRLAGDKDFSWPLESIDVETGLLRFDVCGKLDYGHIGDVAEFRDSNGVIHDAETFYSDYDWNFVPDEALISAGQ